MFSQLPNDIFLCLNIGRDYTAYIRYMRIKCIIIGKGAFLTHVIQLGFNVAAT